MRKALFPVTFALVALSAACGSPSPNEAGDLPVAPRSREDAPDSDAMTREGEDAAEPTDAAPSTKTAPPAPCFAAGAAALVTSIFDDDFSIDKMLLVGSRVAGLHGNLLSTAPRTGGSSRFTVAPGYAFTDAAPSGSRIYTLSSGFIEYQSAMLEASTTVSAYATSGVGLYVDDDYVYFTGRAGYSDGYLARHERENVYSMPGSNLPTTLATGPLTKWIGGTHDRVFFATHDDDGAGSKGSVESMAKPGVGDVAGVVFWTNGSPAGLVVDAAGIVLMVTGEYGETDGIVTFGHDGSSIKLLVDEAAPGVISSLAAASSDVYYVSGERSVMRVARDGTTKPESVATTSSACEVTALAVDGEELFVATSRGTSREIWRLKK